MMNVITWDPFKEFNHLFNRAAQPLGNTARVTENANWSPLVNIYESKQAFLLHAELAGVDKKAVSVSVDKGVLTIKGEKHFSEAKEGESYQRVETQHGEFSRSFTLPENIDTDQISADYKDGVLTLSIPKIKPEAPKVIDVKIH